MVYASSDNGEAILTASGLKGPAPKPGQMIGSFYIGRFEMLQKPTEIAMIIREKMRQLGMKHIWRWHKSPYDNSWQFIGPVETYHGLIGMLLTRKMGPEHTYDDGISAGWIEWLEKKAMG
jgi:hypothetical protein